MSRLFYFFLFLTSTTIGCATSDYSEVLPGNFSYVDEGLDDKYIASDSPGGTNIWGKILSYGYNSDFIIAQQKPSYSNYQSKLAFDIRDSLPKMDDDSAWKKAFVIADSLLKTDTQFQKILTRDTNYWIINIKLDQIYGPLRLNEYQALREQFQIPKSLQLEVP